MPNLPVTSFNTGEITPLIDARSDTEKYAAGCRILENMLPTIYGPVVRRPGTQYIATAKNSPQGVRLIPFIYSADIAYMCEFGDQYIRFYYDKAPLLDGSGNHVEIASPYLVGHLPELQLRQIGDVMWIVHGSYAPRKLSRTSATTFTLTEIEFNNGPFMGRNDIENADDVTLTSSVTAVDATGTLTASSDMFEAGHVGSIWKLTQQRAAMQETITKTGTATGASSTNGIPIKGSFRFESSGAWAGTLVIERNDGAGFITFREYYHDVTTDTNTIESFVEEEDGIFYRLNVTAHGTSSTIRADLMVQNPTQDGIVRVDSIVSAQVANITVLTAVASTSATKRWSEGAWSGVRGFPTGITVCEGRMVYGGTTTQPSTVWFSETDDYENFDEGIKDADSFSRTIASTNGIRWLETLEGVIAGTSGDEWALSSNKFGQVITPTNCEAKRYTTYGSKTIQPIRANNAVLFVDKAGRKLRELTFSSQDGNYVAPDLTALAEHITEGGMTCLAYQKNPNQVVWGFRDDGTLVSMTYERDQNVVAWARHLHTLSQVDTSSTTYFSKGLSAYKLTYISENGAIWGVPINWETGTTLTLDSGDARYVGGSGSTAVVALPCNGHPFKAGQVIRIDGTSHYDGAYTLASGTSDDELYITASYLAETFDGTETVIQYIQVNAGAGRMDQDDDGTLYYGQNTSTIDGLGGIVKVTNGTTKIQNFFAPSGGWPTSKTVTCLKLTKDKQYLYAHADTYRVYKFRVSDGELMWQATTDALGYDLDVDDEGNVYVSGCVAPTYFISKFDKDDGTRTDFGHAISGTMIWGAYNAVVHGEYVIHAGYNICSTSSSADVANLHNLTIHKTDGTGFRKVLVGGTYTQSSNTYSYTISNSYVATTDDFIYVLCNGTIYKLTYELGIASAVEVGSGAKGIFLDLWDHLIVVRPHEDYRFDVYDLELNHLYEVDGNFSGSVMMDLWDAFVGGAWQKGNAAFWPGLFRRETTTTVPMTASGVVNTVAVIPGDAEDEVWMAVERQKTDGTLIRTIECIAPMDFDTIEDCYFVDCGVSYSFDAPSTTLTGLDHLEGETVTILGDGSVYPTQTVTDGTVELSAEVSKASVGLPYTYTLKPVRIEMDTRGGTSRGSYKKIAELVVSLLDSSGVQYGPSMDELLPIPLRTTEPYDSPPELYTGDVVLSLDGGFDPETPIYFTGQDPLPCTIRAIVARVEQTGR